MVWTSFPNILAFAAFLQETRVSKWPRPNTARIGCAFRMALGEGLPFPRPGRFICQMHDVPGEPTGRAYPVIDMEVSGEFELHGESGLNNDGRSIELDIVEHAAADFPGSTLPGIEYHFTVKKVGSDDFNWTWYFESEFPAGTQRDIIMRANENDPINGVVKVVDDPFFLNVDWPAQPPSNKLQWFSMSECYDVQDVAPFPDGAEFNGVDSYIALDHNITGFNQDFVIKARIRLHDPGNFWPLFGRGAAGGFIGMDGADLIFGALRETTTWTPLLNEWFDWRLEFEQPDQLKVVLFIDDLEVAQAIVNRFNTPINRIGVYKQGVSGTIWAHMDVTDLQVFFGGSPSTDLNLYMPLRFNALDASDDENHGTTFNMDLPDS